MLTKRNFLAVMLPVLLMLMTVPFVEHSVTRGLSLRIAEEIGFSRLYHPGEWWSNLAIHGHMIVGGALTLLVPLQLIGIIRQRWPTVHRVVGYLAVSLAIATGVGGLLYILWQGTIGGQMMNVGFSLYGGLVVLCAVQTVRHARQRSPQHRDWALRLVILALGSWFYRVHYTLWYAFTGGLYVEPQFSGEFDQVQNFAFYLPYLLVLEIWLYRQRSRRVVEPLS